eukprot:3247398-Amphidinium_carterae.1
MAAQEALTYNVMFIFLSNHECSGKTGLALMPAPRHLKSFITTFARRMLRQRPTIAICLARRNQHAKQGNFGTINSNILKMPILSRIGVWPNLMKNEKQAVTQS